MGHALLVRNSRTPSNNYIIILNIIILIILMKNTTLTFLSMFIRNNPSATLQFKYYHIVEILDKKYFNLHENRIIDSIRKIKKFKG